MADINEILGRNINSIKELKAAIGELQNSLIGVDTSTEEFKATSEKLAAAQAELNKVTRAGKDDNIAARDSLVGMQREYKALYDQYKMLTEEQRNSDFGKNMAKGLEALSDKINDTKKEVGNFTSNIGRYAQGATEAFSQMGISLGALQTPMKLAAGGAKTLGAALKGLIANPVGAFIMAIVVAFKALNAIAERVKKAINDNEESSNRLREAMATFRPVIDAVSNAFDFLGKVVVRVIEGLTKVAGAIMSIIPGMKQAIQSHKDLAKATNDLTKAQREASVENSKKTAEIERLREEASAVEDVTKKRRLLEEAKALQAEVDQKNIELAQEELRIMTEYGEKTANSAEENEKLAAAQKKVNDAIAQGEKNQRMYNKQLNSTVTTTSSAGKAVDEYKKKAQELYEQLIEDSKDEITKLTEKYQKEKKLLEKYHLDTTLLDKKYEKERTKIYQDTAADKYRERLKAYETDIDAEKRHNDNLAQLDKKGFETRIKQLTQLQYDLLGLKTFWGTAKENSQLFEEFFNAGNWSAIPDSFKDFPEVLEGLHTSLIKLQKDYGITIENAQDLEDNLQIVGQAILDFWEDYVVATIDKRLNDLDWTQLQEEMTMMFGNFDPAAIAVEKARNSYDYLETEKQILQEELAVWVGTYDKKVELMKRLHDVQEELLTRQAELQELNAERTTQMTESLIDMMDRTTRAMNTWRSTRESVIDSEVKAGKISEAEANKQKKRLLELEKVETAFAIATIAADAASGLFNVWKGYVTETTLINPQTAAATGPAAAGTLAALNAKSLVSAIAKSVGLAATASAQIAAARGKYVSDSNNFRAETGGGSSVGVAAAPMLIDSTPYSYTRTVQTTEEEDRLNAPIWVSVEDISSALNRQVIVRDESSF